MACSESGYIKETLIRYVLKIMKLTVHISNNSEMH